jgi:hypothetical protein
MVIKTFERIPVEIGIRLFCGNMFYSGTVLNLSIEGMHINTKSCFPIGTSIVIIVRKGKNLLQVNTKVKSLTRTNGCYDGMDVEILNLSKNYLDYVNSLSPVYEIIERDKEHFQMI